MKLLAFFCLLFTYNALACWRAEGTLAVDGESWKFGQRLEHNVEQIIPMGPFMLKFTINKGKSNEHQMVYVVQEKKGLTLSTLSKGSEEIKEGVKKDIYAKGLLGRPNAIIEVKIINI